MNYEQFIQLATIAVLIMAFYVITAFMYRALPIMIRELRVAKDEYMDRSVFYRD